MALRLEQVVIERRRNGRLRGRELRQFVLCHLGDEPRTVTQIYDAACEVFADLGLPALKNTLAILRDRGAIVRTMSRGAGRAGLTSFYTKAKERT